MKRQSGVLMHVSSLWGDYSCGSFGKEARKFIDGISDAGFSVWQVLPFCLPDDCNSPYKSYSTFSMNPFFIDLPTLFEDGLITAKELEAAKQKVPYACEFDRLWQERLQLLSLAASRFQDENALNVFLKAHPQADAFCHFMAAKKANGSVAWNEWKKVEEDAETLRTWQFAEYEFFTQWMSLKQYANERGVSVVGDVPIYVSYDSSDVWANKNIFQLDAKGRCKNVAGVPPDYFSEDGQLWGNPLYDWKVMKTDNFGWWRERIGFMLELFDGVRIDHFRGLESYYSIPATEKTAKNGSWKKGPGMDLISAIQPLCKNKLVIAEDLGDITEKVVKLVKDSGFPGMRVLQFAFLGDRNSPHLPHNYSANSVAYTGTHDNNTLLGYVWEQTDENRRQIMEYCGCTGDWNACYDGILRTMFESHAGLLVLPIQDLLLYGCDTRLNIPGKSDGNWRFRITEEQFASVDFAKFKNWNRLFGR